MLEGSLSMLSSSSCTCVNQANMVQGITSSIYITEPSPLCTAGGDCKADSSPVDAQGSGVIIDDSATVADGVVAATADCVEVAGTTFQVSLTAPAHCVLQNCTTYALCQRLRIVCCKTVRIDDLL
jgi:hypothetical protein